MTVPTLDSEPDCARKLAKAGRGPDDPRPRRGLIAERRAFDAISRDTWDRLAGLNPWATPFSAWGFHRAWWDAYGENAHDQTLVVLDPDAAPTADPVAIVPIMHRHVVEADDAETHTSIRHGTEADLTPVAPTAKAVYLGATYHADYATLLGDPLDLPEVADAVVAALAGEVPGQAAGQVAIDPRHPSPWDVIDLRRFRTGDPAAEALAAAFGAREIDAGWTLNLETEDVCPVAALPGDGKPATASIDDFLATLDKHDRHEIRRKVRRAEAAGAIELVDSTEPLGDLQSFIELHQAKWGDEGLFPPTRGGDQSRVFVSRMLELLGPDTTAPVGHAHLSFLTLDGKRIGASIFFITRNALLYYNAGVSPDARALSPGVVMVERLVRRALSLGLCRFDFLRGNEPYKYEWGSIDEPIQRLLVRRSVAR